MKRKIVFGNSYGLEQYVSSIFGLSNANCVPHDYFRDKKHFNCYIFSNKCIATKQRINYRQQSVKNILRIFLFSGN